MMEHNELRRIRKSLRINQETFGKLVGVGRVAVSDWERGVNNVPVYAEVVARILDIHPELVPTIERILGIRQAPIQDW